MYTQEERRIIRGFKKDVDQQEVVILDEIKKGDEDDAIAWIEDLENTEKRWEKDMRTPPRVFHHGMTKGEEPVVDPERKKKLAHDRVVYVRAALRRIQRKFEGKSWEW